MTVFIEFEQNPLLFSDPVAIVSCHDPATFRSAFEEIERLLKAGYYLAGFFSYEAGYCFEKRLYQPKTYDFPLLLMGAYKRPVHSRLRLQRSSSFGLKRLQLNIPETTYAANIARIRAEIAAGEVYQITYCIKLHFDFQGDPRRLYAELFRQQPVPYPAYIETDGFQILSLSPERFIRKDGGRLLTEPMKGTWSRGQDVFSDAMARFRFQRDGKNLAENVMIVDLLRNDLGKVADHIAVPKLFTVTGYRTLYQMTSTVTGDTAQDVPLYDLFAALFPSGSVTGAPKIRAMEIIRGIEGEERRIYTGAIGYITPGRDLYFNVPIRTLLIRGSSGEMGVGGGIVWDSTPQGEWEEGLLKARFVRELAGSF
jgi:para-aminobenzoate synthetase/4-amino-4-deoxychorismate lyase